MKTATISQVMAWEPCEEYTVDKVIELFAGRETLTALDMLNLGIPAEDKFWAVLREEMIDAPMLHEFACRCAEEALKLVKNPDTRSIAAIEAKRKWLKGEISTNELAAAAAAADAAWAAAWAADAASDAARAAAAAAADAARAAAWAAAYTAARAAAWAADAASDAARAAAWTTAYTAAWAAAWAADAASDAARAAASDAARAAAAARDVQVEMLKQMLESEGEKGSGKR